MVADDLPDLSLLAALDGVRLVYTDGVLHEIALVVAQEAIFNGLLCHLI